MTKTFPSDVALDAEDQAKLSELESRSRALQQMVVQFQDGYEKRATILQQETQLAWQSLEAKYGLDLKTTLYVTTADFTKLIPAQVRLTDVPGQR